MHFAPRRSFLTSFRAILHREVNRMVYNYEQTVTATVRALALLIGALCVGGLAAQPTPSAVPPAVPAGAAQPPATGETRYPRLYQPPGFYQGVLLIGAAAGKTAAPGGSFIALEKYYDQRLRESIVTGTVRGVSAEPGGPPLTYESEYLPGTFRNLDIEYGAFEHFGLGFSVFSYSIDVLRQDLFPQVGQLRNVAEPLPRRRRLYEGTAATFLFTAHPFSRSLLDPYIALRAGFVGYGGEAHANVDPEVFRFSNRIRNGVGLAYGVGLGMNLHLARAFGIRVEGNYTRQILKSDLFSSRDLSAYHATIGVFFNYNTIAGEIAR